MTMGAHHQDRHARQLPQGKKPEGYCEVFEDKQKDYLQTDPPCVQKTRIADELPSGSQQKLGSFPH